MLTRQSRKRVAICLSPAQSRIDRSPNLARAMAEEVGDVVTTYISAAPPNRPGKEASPPPLIEMMAAANRHEFDVVVADFKAMCIPPWEVSRVMGRLQDLGIEGIDVANSRVGQMEWLMRSLMSETLPRNHGRRGRAGIAAAAKARRAALPARQEGGQTSSSGR